MAERVEFQIKRSRAGNEFYTFRYVKPWGPDNQMRMSGWYPSRLIAARAIWVWAGNNYLHRVKLTSSALQVVCVHPTSNSMESEATITMGIRKLRLHYVEHLKKFLQQGEVAADTTGQLLGGMVEDGEFWNRLHVAAHATPLIWQEELEAALKCETDRWSGHVVECGPVALTIMSACHGLAMPTYTLADLAGKTALPKPFALVHNQGHWVPFWQATFAPPHKSRPWILAESVAGFKMPFEEAASRLQCNLDISCRAAGDCGPHAVLILLDMVLQHGHAGFRRVVPVVQQKNLLQWSLGPLCGEAADEEDEITSEAGAIQDEDEAMPMDHD